MGCDIHVLFQELKGGVWVPAGEDRPNFYRDYPSFDALAGVRGNSYQLYPQRGLPEDLLVEYKEDRDDYTYLGDHSFSWLTLKELRKLSAKVSKKYDEESDFQTLHDITTDLANIGGAEDKLRVVFGFDS